MKKIACCMLLFVFAAIGKNASAQDGPKSSTETPAYYFLPEIDSYYYVPRKQYIYQSTPGGYWTFSRSLPANHKDFNIRNGKKIAVNEPGAYRYFAEHKAKYGSSPSNASVKKDQPQIKSKSPVADKKAG